MHDRVSDIDSGAWLCVPAVALLLSSLLCLAGAAFTEPGIIPKRAPRDPVDFERLPGTC